jgi:hypothetical protein
VPFTQGLKSLAQSGVSQAEGRAQLRFVEAGEQQMECRAERRGKGIEGALVRAGAMEVRPGIRQCPRGRILAAERFARSAPASAAGEERAMSSSGAAGTQQERLARQLFTSTKRRDDEIVGQVLTLICDATVAA